MGAKIRNRYNQVTHLTQDTNGESDKLTEFSSKIVSGQIWTGYIQVIVK